MTFEVQLLPRLCYTHVITQAMNVALDCIHFTDCMDFGLYSIICECIGNAVKVLLLLYLRSCKTLPMQGFCRKIYVKSDLA